MPALIPFILLYSIHGPLYAYKIVVTSRHASLLCCLWPHNMVSDDKSFVYTIRYLGGKRILILLDDVRQETQYSSVIGNECPYTPR
jgi:hypothetical protein